MDKFNFKLQKLLDMRMDHEEESKRQFVQAQNEKIQVENRLETLRDNYKKYCQVNIEESVYFQKIRHNYLNALNSSIDETARDLEHKAIFLEQKREELKEKQIERKTVEKLKEKKILEFKKEQNFIEQKQCDEFALFAYVRRAAK